MKKLLVLFLIILKVNTIQGQAVYFGLPADVNKINIGDKLLLNLPVHSDGRFMKLDDFDSLLNFMKSKSNFRFKINIYYFIGTEKISISYTEGLKESLISIIKNKTIITNYEIVAKGKTNPILLKKQEPYYFSFNSRIEIIVEK